MSTRQFAPVNPGLWEGLDALFGTTLSQEAHKLNISYNPKFDLDRVKILEEANDYIIWDIITTIVVYTIDSCIGSTISDILSTVFFNTRKS